MNFFRPAFLFSLSLLLNFAASAASLHVAPDQAPLGGSINVYGEAPVNNTRFRVFWEQNGVTHPLADGMTAFDGGFDFPAIVPAASQPGLLRLAIHLEGEAVEFAWTEMQVEPPAPASLAGRLTGANPGMPVRLLGPQGNLVAEVITGAGGAFAFAGLPAGNYIVQSLESEHPPKETTLGWGENHVVDLVPIDLSKMPPVHLLGLGAIALPGGSLQGLLPVQVGEWGNFPFARLISLPGKGRPPLDVRVWAVLQKTLTAPPGDILVTFVLRKGTARIRTLPATLGQVHPAAPFDLEAWKADFNAMELPTGPLLLEIKVEQQDYRGVPVLLGMWKVLLQVTDFGPRWYSGNTKTSQLTVKREDFYRLRYEFTGSLPNLPGIGTPLFDQPIDLGFTKLQNQFNLGISVKEQFVTDGGWSGKASAVADLKLFSFEMFHQTLQFVGPTGSSPLQSSYQLSPAFVWPFPAGVHIPVWGVGLPSPINICGFKFDGKVGIFLDLGGAVSLNSTIHPDLRASATVMPAVNLALPTGANIEAGPCKATAQIKPTVSVGAPIVVDPWSSPPVYWDGLCFKLSGTATAALSCCGIGFDKSVNLFNPIQVGNCPAAAIDVGALDVEPLPFAPPLNAAVAFGPAGDQAVAVWESQTLQDGVWARGSPVISFRRSGVWDDPQPVAAATFAGWEPQVAWLDQERVIVTWTCLHVPAGASLPGKPGNQPPIKPQGVCDTVSTVLNLGCSLVGGAIDVASSIVDSLNPFGFTAGNPGTLGVGTPPVFLTDDIWFDGRPVMASDPRSGKALIVWLREQDTSGGPTQRALALYWSEFTSTGWSPADRVDPSSTVLDLQPTVRFDRNGSPAIVWVRDDDGDLGTVGDRGLVMSEMGRLGQWSAPAEIPGLPPAPWTPSLEYDAGNNPLIAFVAPPAREDGVMLPAAGMLSPVHVARRRSGEWSTVLLPGGFTGEQPLMRVGADNRAMVAFRGFGVAGLAYGPGQILAATTDLNLEPTQWNVGVANAGAPSSSQLAAEFDPETGETLLVWEQHDPAAPNTPPTLIRRSPAWLPDLAAGDGGLSIPDPHPAAGSETTLTLTIVNRGLAPLPATAFDVSFYDTEPGPRVQPFTVATVSGPLGFGAQTSVDVPYFAIDRLPRTIVALIDPADFVTEGDEANNRVELLIGGLPPITNLALTAPADGGQVELRWENPAADGTVRHAIWRARSSDGPFELVGVTTGTQFKDDWALEDGEYFYQIVAEDLQGATTTMFGESPVQLAAGSLPDPEQLELVLTRQDDRVTLTWPGGTSARLEATELLNGAGTRWSTISDGILMFGGSASLTLPIQQEAEYYRLTFP